VTDISDSSECNFENSKTKYRIFQNESATPKEVRAVLLKDHRTWKVPERRVAKFVKRQKKRGSGVDDIDDSESTASTMTQRTKDIFKGAAKKAASPFKSIFRKKKDTNLRKESALKPETTETSALNNLLPPTVSKDEEEKADMFVSVPVVETTTPVVETTTPEVDIEARELFYQDDNDGKKESKGLCAPCEGCTIL